MKLTRILFYEVKTLWLDPDKNEESYIVPKDMLRYDEAFVNPELPAVIAIPRFRTRNGVTPGVPTPDRWRSFCCKLTPIIGDRYHSLRAEFNASKWFTYRHSKSYGMEPLVSVPFERYLTVKDHRDL